jgi:uncharacterized protein YaaR (DUF327 family)
MKIQLNPANKRESEKSRKAKSSKSEGVKPFSTFLGEITEKHWDSTVDEMMQDLSEKEKRFVDIQGLIELNEYKKTVQIILQYITSNSFEAQLLKRKKASNKADFLVIKKINEKLLELTQKIVTKNKAFNLMKECEEIRGLIFDLVS